MPTPTNINLNNTTPAAPAGAQNVLWQADASYPDPNDPTALVRDVSAYLQNGTVIGFVINSGATGNDVGPMLAAPHAGTVSKCVVVTKASDASTALTFRIKKNGTDVFSTDPTVAAGTANGTVSTFTALTASPLNVAAGDVFSIDITSGAADWQFTAQLET